MQGIHSSFRWGKNLVDLLGCVMLSVFRRVVLGAALVLVPERTMTVAFRMCLHFHKQVMTFV